MLTETVMGYLHSMFKELNSCPVRVLVRVSLQTQQFLMAFSYLSKKMSPAGLPCDFGVGG